MTKREKLENYYKLGLWNILRLQQAVEKNWISQSEFEEIVGGNNEHTYHSH